MTSQPTTFEGALQAVERDADATIKALGAALKTAKRAKTAAAHGQVRELQQALEAAVGLADQATAVARQLRDGWHFDVGAWFASGDYAKELLAAAAEAGVQAFESDDRILCYPVIVQVSASDTTVVIDKVKDRRVRPSTVVAHLGALQQRPPRFKAEAFIETLASAYDLVVGSKRLRPGAAAKLVDVHKVLTLLPGAARDYTRQEFARDIYLLDQAGIVTTRDGRHMTLPASALTRGTGVITTVTRGGQTKVYAGLAFTGKTR
ncbi:MAG: hypothetical protein ACP5VR_00425 [Acidimicrobiales bacterium]